MYRNRNNVWYVETWDEYDLDDAINSIGASATIENISALKVACRKLFSVSDRQELIRTAARELFGSNEKTGKPVNETRQELCEKTPTGPIDARAILSAIVRAMDSTDGDEATVDVLLNIACDIFDMSQESMLEAMNEIRDYEDLPLRHSCRHRKATQGEEMEKIRVKTPKGTIEARLIPDREYPGIELCYAEQGTGEPGAIMEYTPTHDDVVMRVYDVPHADDDPRVIMSMTQDKEYTP